MKQSIRIEAIDINNKGILVKFFENYILLFQTKYYKYL